LDKKAESNNDNNNITKKDISLNNDHAHNPDYSSGNKSINDNTYTAKSDGNNNSLKLENSRKQISSSNKYVNNYKPITSENNYINLPNTLSSLIKADVSNAHIMPADESLTGETKLAVNQKLSELGLKREQRLKSLSSGDNLVAELNKLSKKHAVLACPTFVKKQNTNSLDIYFSNDFAQKTMSVKRGDAVGYINLREQTEFSYLSNSFGFRLGMGWESGIAFKTGLNYSNINEKFTYTDPNSIQKKTITVVKYVYDDMFNIIDSTITQEVVEIPGSNTVVSKNRYSFLDIPILFQYSLPGKKRLSYDVMVGPYINLIFAQHGKILAQDAKSLIVLQDDNNQFKNNIGLSFFGSFAVNYHLTKNMKISFEPNIRYIPASITKYENNLNQKYLTAGVAAGIKMKI
jgi:hypothetical protein